MKIFITSMLLAMLFCCVFSCNSKKPEQTSNLIGEEALNAGEKKLISNTTFQVEQSVITKDFNTWYRYTYYNVRLADDFIGLDVDSTVLGKSTFLTKLMGGGVIAIKVNTVNQKPVYKLSKLISTDKSIEDNIKQMAIDEMEHFKVEGSQMPKYRFSDLNGTVYTNSSTKGKVVVLKCWFIHCIACVKEFPELNKLVDDNKDRNDILFVSLATDSKEDLEKFLKKKAFRYDVVSDMGSFMTKQLNINAYPTHILVDKEGKILKVANRIEFLLPLIERERLKSSS